MMAEKKKFNEWIKDTAQDAKKVLENAGEKVSVEAKKISEEAVEKFNDLKLKKMKNIVIYIKYDGRGSYE